MNKVILPKEVSKALETIKYNGYNTRDILRMIHVDNIVGRYDSDIATLKQYAVRDTDTLLTALVNGYEVEKSPEDKVREYYELAKNCAEIYALKGHKFDAEQYAIKKTLDLLDIKIEGVNASE
jgi:hypothetical protein